MIFKYGNLEIGSDKVVVIAEAGVNHLRDIKLAEQHIAAAKRAGVDIIKFQTYSAEKLTTRSAPRFWSWDGERKSDGSQYDSYKLLATPEKEFTLKLFELCKKYKIEFMSTPFDIESSQMLNEIGSHGFKIASGDITNIPLIKEIASYEKPIFLSTGASSINEIKTAVEVIESIGSSPICIMHCTLCYPTRFEDANLSALLEIQENFPSYVLGLSDHTIGPLTPALSVMYGAKAIEKHFTIDKTLPDSADHWLSVDEKDISDLVGYVRIAERVVGNGHKVVLRAEEVTRANARRSIVAKGNIKKGEKFTQNNLTTKRPAHGISALYFEDVLGLTSARDIFDDEMIGFDDISEDVPIKPITSKNIKNVYKL